MIIDQCKDTVSKKSVIHFNKIVKRIVIIYVHANILLLIAMSL